MNGSSLPTRAARAANQLEGTIPPCLVESPALLELYLSSNRRLGGTLPAPPPGSRLMALAAGNAVGAGSWGGGEKGVGWQGWLAGGWTSAAAVATPRRRPFSTLPPSAHPPTQNLTGWLPDLRGAAQLQALRVQGNGLSGPLPALPGSIREANLEYNALTWVGC